MSTASTPTQIILDDSAREQIRNARVRRKRIDRVLGVASFNGWSEATFATLSVIIGLIDPSLITVIAAVALTAVACTEFKGRAMVRQLNSRGLSVLSINQLAFGGLIILYALWQLYSLTQGGDSHLAELADYGEMGQQIAELQQVIARMVYWSLIAGTILFQGGMALFYHRSHKPLKAYMTDTPAWVIDILRAAQ